MKYKIKRRDIFQIHVCKFILFDVHYNYLDGVLLSMIEEYRCIECDKQKTYSYGENMGDNKRSE